MKKVIKLSLLIIWFGLIFYMSATNGENSGNMSSGLLRQICLFLRLSNVDEIVLKYNGIFRKFAHFTEYFILGLLLYINLIDRFSDKKAFIYSLLICVLYAASDEIHQLFVSDRSGNVIDVLIDSSGSLTGIFLTHLIKQIVTTRKGN